MTCHDARELFSARADDALSGAEQAELQAHLVTCPECQREWARFEQTVVLLRGIEPAHAPAGFVDRVVAARPRPWYSRLARELFLPWPVKLPLEAAAIVMVAGLAIMIVQRSPELQQAARVNDAPPPVAIPAEPAKEAPADSTATSVTGPAPPSETFLHFQREGVARSKGRSASQSREDARDAGVGARFGEQGQNFAEPPRDRAGSAPVERAKKMDAPHAEERKEAATANELSAPTAAPATAPSMPPSAPSVSATAPAAKPSAPQSSTRSAPTTTSPETAPSPAPAPAPAPATAQPAPAPARQPQLSAGEQGLAKQMTPERSAALGLIRATDRLQAHLTVADRAAAESTVRDLVTRAGGSVQVLPAASQPDASATVMTLLVPADRWDEIRRGLEAVGKLRVTGQKVEDAGQLLITLRLER